MAESRRNPAVARIFQDVERDVKAHIVGMLKKASERGEISANVDHDGVATMLMTLADGTSWRRAVDPSFDAEAVLPLILRMVRCLLAPQPSQSGEQEKAR